MILWLVRYFALRFGHFHSISQLAFLSIRFFTSSSFSLLSRFLSLRFHLVCFLLSLATSWFIRATRYFLFASLLALILTRYRFISHFGYHFYSPSARLLLLHLDFLLALSVGNFSSLGSLAFHSASLSLLFTVLLFYHFAFTTTLMARLELLIIVTFDIATYVIFTTINYFTSLRFAV